MQKRLKDIFGITDIDDLDYFINILPVYQINVYKGFAVYGELYGGHPIETINIRAASDDFCTKEEVIHYIKTGENPKDDKQKRLVNIAQLQVKFANEMEKKLINIKDKKGSSCKIKDKKLSAKVRNTLANWACQKYGVQKEENGDTITFFN